jgi:hypothetical protein
VVVSKADKIGFRAGWNLLGSSAVETGVRKIISHPPWIIISYYLDTFQH